MSRPPLTTYSNLQPCPAPDEPIHPSLRAGRQPHSLPWIVPPTYAQPATPGLVRLRQAPMKTQTLEMIAITCMTITSPGNDERLRNRTKTVVIGGLRGQRRRVNRSRHIIALLTSFQFCSENRRRCVPVWNIKYVKHLVLHLFDLSTFNSSTREMRGIYHSFYIYNTQKPEIETYYLHPPYPHQKS